MAARQRRKRIGPAVLVYVVVAVVITAGLITWDRAARPAPLDPQDPRVRAKAAAQSITGQPTVRRVDVPGSGRVVVHATSKYYDAKASPEYNREYLATEGRLIVQLILFDMPDISRARVELYAGRLRVAAVEGRGDQKYEQYEVSYDGPLAR